MFTSMTPRKYKSYLVHRKAELTVKDAAGAQTQLRVFWFGAREERAIQSLQLRRRLKSPLTTPAGSKR